VEYYLKIGRCATDIAGRIYVLQALPIGARKAASAWPLVILAWKQRREKLIPNRPDYAVPCVPPIGYGPVRYGQLRPLWGRGRTGYPYHVIRPATHCTPQQIGPPVPSTVPRDTVPPRAKSVFWAVPLLQYGLRANFFRKVFHFAPQFHLLSPSHF